jgi:hypothetical protein
MRKVKVKGSTATGMSIIDVALKLKKQDPTLSFEESKEKAKSQVKARKESEKKITGARQILEYGKGGKLKNTVLKKLLGERMGGMVSGVIRTKASEEAAAATIIGQEKERDESIAGMTPKEKSERVAKVEYQKILKKLTQIESEVKQIRSVKVAAPSKEEPVLKSPQHEDAHAALLALGFSKKEAQERLKGATGSTSEELIKHALKSHNAERVPTAQVPVVAEVARASINQPAPTVTPTDPNIHQNEAAAAKAEEERKKAEEQDHADKKKILDELDEIKKHQSGGLIDSLMKMFTGLLAPALALLGTIGTALSAVAAPILAVAAAAYAGYKIGQWLEKKFNLGSHIADFVGKLTGQNAEAERATKSTTFEENSHNTNKALEGSGYKLVSPGTYEGPNKEKVKAADLPPEIKMKIESAHGNKGTINRNAPAVPPATEGVVPTDVPSPTVAPTVTPSVANKIEATSSENEQLKQEASAPVINQVIKNDNRIINRTMQSGGGDGGVGVINVRNSEPSAAGYIGQLFNHPVMRFPL